MRKEGLLDKFYRDLPHGIFDAEVPKADLVEDIASIVVSFKAARVGYLSTPITTGARFFECATTGSASVPSLDDLIELNISHARSVSQWLTANGISLIINPAEITPFAGWSQPDYWALWCTVIGKSADVVIFNDGWEYSRGCVCEYGFSIWAGLPVCDRWLHPLQPQKTLDAIDVAMAAIKNSNQDTTVHMSVLSALSERV